MESNGVLIVADGLAVDLSTLFDKVDVERFDKVLLDTSKSIGRDVHPAILIATALLGLFKHQDVNSIVKALIGSYQAYKDDVNNVSNHD